MNNENSVTKLHNLYKTSYPIKVYKIKDHVPIIIC